MTTAPKAQSMTPNAVRKRAYKARTAKSNPVAVGNMTGGGPVGAADATPPVGGEPDLSIDVKVDAGAPKKLSLRERLGLGGKATATPAKRPAVKRGKQENLIVTLLPTLGATLIATYAKDRIPVEYQACAPSQEEVQRIIGPLIDIIGRRVEVAAQVSQDAIDLTNSLICGIAYGLRAYVTYVEIKKDRERHANQKAATYTEPRAVGNDSQPEPTLTGGLRAYQATNSGASGNSAGIVSVGSREPEPRATSNGTGVSDDDTELRSYEAGLIADLFERDKQGRKNLGLLPAAI